MNLQKSASAVVSSHAGELIQGPIIMQDGSVEKAIVTLRTENFRTCITVEESRDDEYLNVGELTRELREYLDTKFHKCARLRIKKFSNIPVGRGLGSSTSDLYAFAKAYCRFYEIRIPDEAIFELGTSLETYSDPLHLNGNFLFLSRKKKPLYALPVAGLKLYTIVTFSRLVERFDTEDLSGYCYTPHHIRMFSMAQVLLSNGLRYRSIPDIMRAAKISAELNQEVIDNRDARSLYFDLCKLAVGYSISHSGSAICFHFTSLEARSDASKHLKGINYEVIESETTF